MSMTVAEKIQKSIRGRRRGEPFTPRELLCLGSRESVDQVLHKLTREGTLQRVTRGVYVKPKIHPVLGTLAVSVPKVLQALAGRRETIQPSGAAAANRLGLSTQVPVRLVYWTSGHTRELWIGKQRVELLHVDQRYLTPGKAGDVVRCLRYLGKDGIAPETIRELSSQLDGPTQAKLLRLIPQLPGWMGDAVRRIAQDL